LTHFVSAVHFLDNVDAKALTISPEEFESSIARCKLEARERAEYVIKSRTATSSSSSSSSSSSNARRLAGEEDYRNHRSSMQDESVSASEGNIPIYELSDDEIDSLLMKKIEASLSSTGLTNLERSNTGGICSRELYYENNRNMNMNMNMNVLLPSARTAVDIYLNK
jgi:hypothetical protein